jgi:hypothetical protein
MRHFQNGWHEDIKLSQMNRDEREATMIKTDGATRNLIGYFATKESKEFENFRRVAGLLKNDCASLIVFGKDSERKQPTVAFINAETKPNNDETFGGDLLSNDEFGSWAAEKCTPLDREATSGKGKGYPLVIMYLDESDLLEDKENEKKAKEDQSLNALDSFNYSRVYYFSKHEEILAPGRFEEFLEDYLCFRIRPSAPIFDR